MLSKCCSQQEENPRNGNARPHRRPFYAEWALAEILALTYMIPIINCERSKGNLFLRRADDGGLTTEG